MLVQIDRAAEHSAVAITWKAHCCCEYGCCDVVPGKMMGLLPTSVSQAINTEKDTKVLRDLIQFFPT